MQFSKDCHGKWPIPSLTVEFKPRFAPLVKAYQMQRHTDDSNSTTI